MKKHRAVLSVVVSVVVVAAASSLSAGPMSATVRLPAQVAVSAGGDAQKLVVAARRQVGVTTGYDPTYVKLAYPGGDVDQSTGVCTDVVVRALRTLNIDLQERIHVDMVANRRAYSTKWGTKKADTNIDHRRVRNIATYFTRRGYSLAVTNDPTKYLPGDIVSMQIPLDHIGIVSDRKKDGRPLVIHNVGSGTQEEDVLFAWKLIGHYRVLRS